MFKDGVGDDEVEGGVGKVQVSSLLLPDVQLRWFETKATSAPQRTPIEGPFEHLACRALKGAADAHPLSHDAELTETERGTNVVEVDPGDVSTRAVQQQGPRIAAAAADIQHALAEQIGHVSPQAMQASAEDTVIVLRLGPDGLGVVPAKIQSDSTGQPQSKGPPS